MCWCTERLDYDTIINVLKNGEFYASQGPEIKSLVRDGDTVTVKTSPAARISLSTAGRRAKAKNAAEGETVSEATFKIRPDDGYFRITVMDKNGKYANSRGYEI